MGELKLISPMFDNLAVGGVISEHHGVRCYPAMDETTEQKYIIKVVSIPASRTQLDALLLSGAYADESAALIYFKEQADEIMQEVQVLEKLAQLEGFCAYEQSQLVPMDDDVGLLVYLKGSYKHTLERTMQKKPMTHLAAVNLGIDICAALTVCRRAGYLYVDLKPDNIIIGQDNTYKIGDLGLLRMSSLQYASLPDRYRSAYTAPEIADAFSYLNDTIDVYALGRILYQIYNNGTLPELDPEDDSAQLVAPANADYEMSEIILKACAADPADRWADPAQMGQALVSYMQRNGANDEPIVPPVVILPEAEEAAQEPAEEETAAEPIALAEEPEAAVEEAETTEEAAPSEEAAAFADMPDAFAAVPAPAIFDVEKAMDEEVQAATETEPEAAPVAQEPEAPVDETDAELDAIAMLLQPSEDETAPEYNEEVVDYGDVSEEITQILAQADEIVNHPVPEPAVAPEPAAVDLEQAAPAEEAAEDAPAEEAAAEEPASQQAEEAQPQAAEEAKAEKAEEADPEQVAEVPAEDQAAEAEEDYDPYVPPKKKKNWVLFVILGLLLAGMILVGIYFYQNYYLLPVESMTVTGEGDQVTVTVVTTDPRIDPTIFTVSCSGPNIDNRQAQLGVDGTVTFENLYPGSNYVFSLSVSGFHKLTGDTSPKPYATPKSVTITKMELFTGEVNGSVDIVFETEKAFEENWKITYSAQSEGEKSIEFEGTEATVSGLTVGTTYTFTLTPADEAIYVVGENTATRTAENAIYAENLAITSCMDETMTVVWTTPEGAKDVNWYVHCSDTQGNEFEPVLVDPPQGDTVTLTDIADTHTYNIEIIAEGMRKGTTISKPANAITLPNPRLQAEDLTTSATITWDKHPNVDSWMVSYTIDDYAFGQEQTVDGTSFTIEPLIPGATYQVEFKTADGNIPLNGTFTFTTEEAEDFAYDHAGVQMDAEDLEGQLCIPKRGDKRWKSKTFTTTFKAGDDAGLYLEAGKKHQSDDTEYTRLFVIRDSEGAPIMVQTTPTATTSWNYMWAYHPYTELDIPALPEEPGNYTLYFYLNNQLVDSYDFTVTE